MDQIYPSLKFPMVSSHLTLYSLYIVAKLLEHQCIGLQFLKSFDFYVTTLIEILFVVVI